MEFEAANAIVRSAFLTIILISGYFAETLLYHTHFDLCTLLWVGGDATLMTMGCFWKAREISAN